MEQILDMNLRPCNSPLPLLWVFECKGQLYANRFVYDLLPLKYRQDLMKQPFHNAVATNQHRTIVRTLNPARTNILKLNWNL